MAKVVINPTSDIFIKYLLGSEKNKELLLSFINETLVDSGFPRIISVEIKNPFNINNFANEKQSILDIKATDENKRIYDVEVQTVDKNDTENRFLYYWSKLYSEQLNKGDDYTKARPVISINLLTYSLFKNIEKYHSCFVIKEKDEHKDIILTDDLQIHFIELNKFQKMTKDNDTEFDKWLSFFKFEGQDREDKMQVLLNDQIIAKAHQEYIKFSSDDQMRELYASRERWQMDYNTDIHIAKERGIEQGIGQGIGLGKKEQAIDTAKKLKAQNVNIEIIKTSTGLSIDEIMTLN